MSSMHIPRNRCWTSSRVCTFRRRLNFPQRRYEYLVVNIWLRDHCLPAVSSHFVINFTSMWFRTFSIVLPNTALFISLYRFFSKLFFVRVILFIEFNVIRSQVNWVNCNTRWIFTKTSTLLQVTIVDDVTLLLHSVARSLYSHLPDGLSRVG